MALKLSIPTSSVGIPFTEAYARITNIMDGLYADLKMQPGFEGAEDC